MNSTQLYIAVSWTSCSESRFNVDFDRYDLEIEVSGSRHFDIHDDSRGLIEFDIDSSSDSFHVSHMCTAGTLTNVPVPASNTRTWKITKTSSYVYIYCSGYLVGQFSRSSHWSCLSNDQWANFGRNFYFYSDSSGTNYYRLVSTSSKYVINIKHDIGSSKNPLFYVL